MTLSFNPVGTRVVLIGTTKSLSDPEHLPELPAVANNIDALKAILLDPDLVGLSSECIETIVDAPSASQLLTRLSKAAKSSTDTLLVYYAGHGLKSATANGLFLAALETTQDECHLDGVDFTRVRQIIFDSPAAKKILIFDCCYSGEVASDQMGADSSVISNNIQIKGTYSIASAPRNSIAYSPIGEKFSSFSRELISVLERGIQESVEFITIDKLYDEVKRRIASNPTLPAPQRKVELDAGEFVIARNVAWSSSPEVRLQKLEKQYKGEIARLVAEAEQSKQATARRISDLEQKIAEKSTLDAGAKSAYASHDMARQYSLESRWIRIGTGSVVALAPIGTHVMLSFLLGSYSLYVRTVLFPPLATLTFGSMAMLLAVLWRPLTLYFSWVVVALGLVEYIMLIVYWNAPH
jgi:hypothetical protein